MWGVICDVGCAALRSARIYNTTMTLNDPVPDESDDSLFAPDEPEEASPAKPQASTSVNKGGLEDSAKDSDARAKKKAAPVSEDDTMAAIDDLLNEEGDIPIEHEGAQRNAVSHAATTASSIPTPCADDDAPPKKPSGKPSGGAEKPKASPPPPTATAPIVDKPAEEEKKEADTKPEDHVHFSADTRTASNKPLRAPSEPQAADDAVSAVPSLASGLAAQPSLSGGLGGPEQSFDIDGDEGLTNPVPPPERWDAPAAAAADPPSKGSNSVKGTRESSGDVGVKREAPLPPPLPSESVDLTAAVKKKSAAPAAAAADSAGEGKCRFESFTVEPMTTE